jgi:DNA-binding transcriptional ArsR family regulator
MKYIVDIDLMHEIRAAILRNLYEQEKTKPYSWIDAEKLGNELGLTLKEVDFHLNYLEEKGFIRYERVLGGGGLVRITALGIDAVESPEQFVKTAPFLQQLIIYGNVVDSTILQAESIRIRNGLNRIAESVSDAELKELIDELIKESRKDAPDGNKLKVILQQIKEISPDIASKLLPYVQELLKKWLLG